MKPHHLCKGDYVRIEWSDPHALPGEWLKPSAKDMAIDGCITIGQVYKIHNDRVTIICNWDSILKNVNGGITIPFVLMKKITLLMER